MNPPPRQNIGNNDNPRSFQISFNPDHHRQNLILQDPALHLASVDGYNAIINNLDRPLRGRPLKISDNMTEDSSKENHKGKMMVLHREQEKQRRQDMRALHISLRSLLPLELIKGKRAISDHVNEAARYIKQLEEGIKEMKVKRDDIKIANLNNMSTTCTGGETVISTRRLKSAQKKLSSFRIYKFHGGVEIVISTGIDEFPLSTVLEFLLQEGLHVFSCASTRLKDRLLHTIQMEVNDFKFDDLSKLQEKLIDAIPSLRHMSDEHCL